MQNFSVDEILNEIVGMDDNIHWLLVAMYSNTLKDLITYKGGHPDLLLEAMGNHPKNEVDLFHVHYKENDAWLWINWAKVAIKMCHCSMIIFVHLKSNVYCWVKLTTFVYHVANLPIHVWIAELRELLNTEYEDVLLNKVY